MSLEIKILIAFILDLIFGDPYRIPHPIKFIGILISKLEKILIKFKYKKLSGIILNLIVLSLIYILFYFISKNIFLEIYFMYTVFATRCLGNEGFKVYKILKSKDIEKAKKELSYLVSRNTENMDEKTIIRSTMETISENIVDGIIAPMFFMFIGALPLAMTYKAINTMDSMLGYKNEKYIDFGFFSAKIDDFVNLIPARITGIILIPLSSFFLRYNFKNSIKIFFRDRKNHASPNSAHPESAVAGALGIQFGGKTEYFGKVYDKPTIGDKLKEFEISDILKNIKIMYLTAILGLIFFEVIYIVFIKKY